MEKWALNERNREIITIERKNKGEINILLSYLQTNKENPHQRSLFNCLLLVERGRGMKKMKKRNLKS